MGRTTPCVLALLLAASQAGCSPTQPVGANDPAAPAADDVKPVAPPADVVGKWRLEVKEGKSTRTSVYHFKKDGSVEVDTRIETPDRKVTDLVKRAVVKVEKDQITMVDLSRTGSDGVEDVLPAERRRTRTVRIEVKDGELQWTEVPAGKKPDPDAKPTVLKRVKE